MNKAITVGSLSSLGLLAIYFAIVTLVSGWDFAQSQFATYWYYVVTLALGFGIQVGLYQHLKRVMMVQHGGAVVATTGATSTAAMLACCAHYLANIIPLLGVVGVVTVIAQYQVQLFWVGLAFNLAGIGYLALKVRKAGVAL